MLGAGEGLGGPAAPTAPTPPVPGAGHGGDNEHHRRAWLLLRAPAPHRPAAAAAARFSACPCAQQLQLQLQLQRRLRPPPSGCKWARTSLRRRATPARSLRPPAPGHPTRTSPRPIPCLRRGGCSHVHAWLAGSQPLEGHPAFLGASSSSSSAPAATPGVSVPFSVAFAATLLAARANWRQEKPQQKTRAVGGAGMQSEGLSISIPPQDCSLHLKRCWITLGSGFNCRAS